MFNVSICDKILCSSLLIRRWGTYHEFLIDILDSNIWLFHFRWVHTCFTQGFKNLWLQIKLNDRMQLWQYFEGDVLNKSRTLVLCLSRKNKTFMTISWVRLFLQQNTQRMGLLNMTHPILNYREKLRSGVGALHKFINCFGVGRVKRPLQVCHCWCDLKQLRLPRNWLGDRR